MPEPNEKLVQFPQESSRDVLTEVLHRGAQQMLLTAIEAEVDDYLAARAATVDAAGRRRVVRNGHLPTRAIQTPLGDVRVQQPRVRDRRPVGERETFRSAILPPYLRKTTSLEELYGSISRASARETSALAGAVGARRAGVVGDDDHAAQGGVGAGLPRVVAAVPRRPALCLCLGRRGVLQRPPRGHGQQAAVHFGADGCHAGGEEGADRDHRWLPRERTVVARAAAGRARAASRSTRNSPSAGGLGFWGAVRKVFPKTREQRCWVHKTMNVLNKLPKGVQPKAKGMLHDIWMAETTSSADQAFDLFVTTFHAKFPAATACLEDRDVLLTFYDFPAEHWIRTTNPVESTFATVRLRTRKTKGAGSRLACDDGVQAGDGRAEDLESVEPTDRRCHRRCALRRWRPKGSRLIMPHTQHLAISLAASRKHDRATRSWSVSPQALPSHGVRSIGQT